MKSSVAVRIAIGFLLLTTLFPGCVGQQDGQFQQGTPGGKLYISNFGDSSLLTYGNAVNADGNLAPTQKIQDLNTQSFILNPAAVFVDTASDVLYVANTGLNQILIYNNASIIDGNAVPDRVISGAATTLNFPRGLTVDTVTNIMYVANAGSNSILVFNSASTVDGDVEPSRTITGLSQPWGLFVDTANDRLYAANAGQNSVLAFDNASNSATLDPARTITFSNATTLPIPRMSTPSGLFVDTASDVLYVANHGNDSILIFNNASIIDSESIPDRAISGGQTNLSDPAGIFVDAGLDILYVAATNNALLVFDNASTADGDVTPDRTISGTATSLSIPAGLFVDVAADVLYTAISGNNSFAVFNSASTATGNLAPDRAISDAATPLAFPSGIFGDVTRDLLYVAGLTSSITVFEHASALKNIPAPVIRTILPASGTACGDIGTSKSDLCSPRGISVDAINDRLFAANTGASSILVFDNASSIATGMAPPSHTLLPASGTVCGDGASTKMDLCAPFGVFVDTVNDRLYVANTVAGSILVFDNASSITTGMTPPSHTLLPASGTVCGDSATTKMDLCTPGGVFVDTVNDRLYVANTDAGSILVFDNASSITSGTIIPTRTISPASGTACGDSASTMMDLCSPATVFVDAVNDELYVTNSGAHSILVFDNAGTADGNVAPSRTIAKGTDPNDNTSLNLPFGIFVDTTR